MGVLRCARCQQYATGDTQKEAAPKIDHGASSKVKCPANPDHLVWHENATVEDGKILIPAAATPKKIEPAAEAVTEPKAPKKTK